ncbi:MAG: hypothetical protein JWO62_3121 [Acidimicrobiaceae bacterium]|nr:hypothetical protein [Acidimicrobiaceae bacterium]
MTWTSTTRTKISKSKKKLVTATTEATASGDPRSTGHPDVSMMVDGSQPDSRLPDGQGIPRPSSHPVATILNGLSWNTLGQITIVLVNLALTPFLLIRLGVDRYGVFAVLASFRGLLSNLDGGLGPTATRYFAVYAGAGDRKSTSSLLFTISCMLAVVTGAVAGLVALFAPDITVFLHASVSLRGSAANLLRAFMPLLFVTSLQGLVARIISAHHRWAYLNCTEALAGIVYAGLAVLFVEQGRGLTGLLWASIGQLAVLLITSVAGARRYVAAQEFRLMPFEEIREIIRYASRVQVAEVASSFNIEIDALLVGLIFPVRYVAFYSIGSNFATQLLNLPLNAVSPIAVTLSRTFGRVGLDGTLDEFTSLQRLWVRAVAGFPLIGAASAYFAIARWLGPQERLAGVIAAVLLLGQTMSLMSQVMGCLAKSVNKPGLESRYLGLGMLINIAFTIPLALTVGVVGVPAGTALGQVASTLYFLHIARRRITPDIRSFLADVPRLPLVLGLVVTVSLELAAYRVAPIGAAGLALCAVPALIGLMVYAVTTYGVRQLASQTAAWMTHTG